MVGCSGVMGMIVGGSWALCVGQDGGGIGWALGEEKKRKSKKRKSKIGS